MKQVLEYAQRLVKVLPPDVFAWDDASNNKYLISGQGSLIMNPPSAWAVAKRDNPKVAEQCWTFPSPKGVKGRYAPGQPFFWGIWKWSKNIPAAKSLLAHLSERSSIERMVAASGGYDIPGFSGLRDFKTWAEEGPPKGHGIQLSAAGRSDRLDRRSARAGEDRQPDLQPGDHDQDDRQVHPGRRVDRQSDRLGRLGTRRFHAHLKLEE